MLHVRRYLGNARIALAFGVGVLVLATCTPQLPFVSADAVADESGDLDVASITTTIEASESTGLPPLPSPAPADQPSAPVEPLQDLTDELNAQLGQPTVEEPELQFKPVKAQVPKIRVAGLRSREAMRKIRKIEGVRFATAITVGTLAVGPARTPVTVAAVDPAQFRRLTPQVTTDAVAVWERIAEGDAAFTHDTGHRLKAELGSTVAAGAEGSALRVGAYASNGVPPVADLIVSPGTAESLRIGGQLDALIAVRKGQDPRVVAARIDRAIAGKVTVLEEPVQRRAFITGASARNAFEPFTYIDNGDGMIQIDPDWVRRNIVRRPMPLLKGEVVCHRMMVDQLYGALKEIEDRGLGHLIDASQYGGCWVPRHIDFNPAKPLSMHAWGLAADFNVSTNGLGQKPQMDRRIVEVFDRWGFVWGGRWSRPDGMHFELGALLRSPQG